MTKRTTWDFSLVLKGVSPDTLPMSRLAAYMASFAGLLGDDAKPVFAGLVKGSAVLRAHDRSGFPTLTRSRMKAAAVDDESPARLHFEKITAMSAVDAVRARVVDSTKQEVIAFPAPVRRGAVAEIIVDESSEVDGVVVGVEGTDDTAHIRLIDQATGQTIRMQVRDMAVARSAARHFRGPVIRAKVRGKWRRDSEGVWQPHSLYADEIEELDQAPAVEVFRALRALPGNGWAAMPAAEADALLAELRGDD